MKIYEPELRKFVRLMISQQGQQTEYLNLVECTREEVRDFIKDLISKQTISPFANGKKTSVVVRDAIGGQNLKSESVSFRGITPKQVSDLITQKLKQNESN